MMKTEQMKMIAVAVSLFLLPTAVEAATEVANRHVERLTEALELSDEQVGSVSEIFSAAEENCSADTDFRECMHAQREDIQASIEELLSAEQLGMFSSLREERGAPPQGRMDRASRMQDELDLSDDQTALVQEIMDAAHEGCQDSTSFAEHRECMEAQRSSVEDELSNVLSEEQFEQLQSLRSERQGRGGPRDPRGMGGNGERGGQMEGDESQGPPPRRGGAIRE